MPAQAKRTSQVTPTRTNEPTRDLQDEIRRRAYELYEFRGRLDGHDMDDWLQSESEVMTKRKREPQTG